MTTRTLARIWIGACLAMGLVPGLDWLGRNVTARHPVESRSAAVAAAQAWLFRRSVWSPAARLLSYRICETHTFEFADNWIVPLVNPDHTAPHPHDRWISISVASGSVSRTIGVYEGPAARHLCRLR